jgi:putative endonuclease
MFYVYVLQSDMDTGLYIGYSSDLRKRIVQHKRGAAFATSYRGSWKLIYYEAYLNQADALGREEFLKSGSGRSFLKRQMKHYLATHPLRTA